MGLAHGEKTQLCKEGIRPAPMIGETASRTGPLLLFAQDRAQPAADETIHAAEGVRMR